MEELHVQLDVKIFLNGTPILTTVSEVKDECVLLTLDVP